MQTEDKENLLTNIFKQAWRNVVQFWSDIFSKNYSVFIYSYLTVFDILLACTANTDLKLQSYSCYKYCIAEIYNCLYFAKYKILGKYFG